MNDKMKANAVIYIDRDRVIEGIKEQAEENDQPIPTSFSDADIISYVESELGWVEQSGFSVGYVQLIEKEFDANVTCKN